MAPGSPPESSRLVTTTSITSTSTPDARSGVDRVSATLPIEKQDLEHPAWPYAQRPKVALIEAEDFRNVMALRQHEGRRQKGRRSFSENGCTLLMKSLTRVERRQKAARGDENHDSPNPDNAL